MTLLLLAGIWMAATGVASAFAIALCVTASSADAHLEAEREVRELDALFDVPARCGRAEERS